MRPVFETSRRVPVLPSPELRLAADTVLAAAEALAEETSEVAQASRYLGVAERISRELESPQANRQRLLMASPAVTEMSGCSRTLIEMIEAEPGDEAYRLRLAKLLLRALNWRSETFPMPPG
jgi:hypothetical protein